MRSSSIRIATLVSLASCPGTAKFTPPQEHDSIVIDFDTKRIRTNNYDIASMKYGRDEWLAAVQGMSLGLNAPLPQVTTHPRLGDSLPVECDTPRSLLDALAKIYSSVSECRGQVADGPLGPVATLQCELPNPEASIACPSFYRAFVWGEIDAESPPVKRDDGRERLSFTIQSLAFVSSSCGRGAANYYRSQIDPNERGRLEGTGAKMREFFARCEPPSASGNGQDGGTK